MLSAHASGHKDAALIVFKEQQGEIPGRVLAWLRVPDNVKISG